MTTVERGIGFNWLHSEIYCVMLFRLFAANPSSTQNNRRERKKCLTAEPALVISGNLTEDFKTRFEMFSKKHKMFREIPKKKKKKREKTWI